jgi:hypothetical protein
MKKALIVFVLVLPLTFSSCAFATSNTLFDTISQYSTEELLQLRQLIDDELEQRNVIPDEAPSSPTYILNTNTRRFHYPSCASVGSMKVKNKAEFFGTREEAIQKGYKPCGNCQP